MRKREKKKNHRPLTVFFLGTAHNGWQSLPSIVFHSILFWRKWSLKNFSFQKTHPFSTLDTKLLMSADSLRSMALLETGFYFYYLFVIILHTASWNVIKWKCSAAKSRRLKNDDEFDVSKRWKQRFYPQNQAPFDATYCRHTSVALKYHKIDVLKNVSGSLCSWSIISQSGAKNKKCK